MALTDKLVCQIAGVFLSQDINGVLDPQAGAVIVAQADTGPLAIQQQSGAWQDYLKAPHVNAICSGVGAWQLGLPAQTDCSPATVKWSISRPDGAVWSGPVTAAMVTASQGTPLSVKNLLDTYGWGLVATAAAPVLAVQGLQGLQGIQGIQGPAGTIAPHAATHEPGGTDDIAAQYGHLTATEIPNIPRYDMNTQIAGLVSGTTTGTLYLSYFTSPTAATITQLLMRTSLTAAVFGATAPGLFAGLYSVDSSGNLTLVYQSADLYTMAFAATSTPYQLALTKNGVGSALASYTFTPRTQRYAYALLMVNATTPPTLVGQSGVAEFLGRAPKISGSLAAQATLPATILAASVVSTGTLLGFIGLP